MKTTESFKLAIAATVLITPSVLSAAWPDGVSQVSYPCTADDSEQPALIYSAEAEKANPRPLLVALHTWSGDFKQEGGQTVFARWCIQQNWHLIHPNFRGPNRTPEALGSELAVQDIVDAVTYMQKNYAVDANRIYLVGVSGGGHGSLLMAGRHPDIWAGVSAWCGISDIEAWWRQCSDAGRKYSGDIEKACGGEPHLKPEAAEECRKRSPLTYLENASGVNLDIAHGIEDGRTGSVPFSHSLYAFDKVVGEEGGASLGAKEIEAFYASQKAPAGSVKPRESPLFGKKLPLFQRTSGNARVTIFDGGHEIVHEAALNWLAAQRKGKPAVWEITDPVKIETGSSESESGK